MKIYKITNKINDMVYIGRTSKSIESRWKDHQRDAFGKRSWQIHKFQRAIKDFGAENFTVEQIDVAATKEEADEKEIYWIEFYNATEKGYNTSIGGKNSGRNCKVTNVETGEIFVSMVEAANAYGVNVNAIRQAVKNPTWKCCGCHWKKAE